jgi:hypothetical protein
VQAADAPPVLQPSVMRTLDKWHQALLIIVLALPFLGQGIPYPGGVPLFLPFAALLLPATVLLRIAQRGRSGLILGDSDFMVICGVILLSYVYGIILSADYPGIPLLRDLITGIVAMIVVFTVCNADWTKSDRVALVNALAWTLFLIGVFVGAMGALKFGLFVMRGQMLDFVAAASSGPYPWGTSLVSDYNFYALTVLVAILAAMFLAANYKFSGQVFIAVIIVGLFVVGFLAGSRRFWLAAPIFIAIQSLWMISGNGLRRCMPLFSTFLFLLVIGPFMILLVGDVDPEQMMTSGWNLQYRLSTFLDATTGFGLSSRFDLWSAATERLTGATPWVGSGFDYMRWFSCEFGDCSGNGYPHMPLLSAYLYGGVVAAIAVAALYVYTIIAGLRLVLHGGVLGWLLFPMLAALVFAAISSNGPLSIRTHVLLGAFCVGLLYAERNEHRGFRNHNRSFAELSSQEVRQ